ncbi:MAG TPA: ATP-binding protein [Chitinophagaceae bacterium]
MIVSEDHSYLLEKIHSLESRLAESEQLIEAIKAGEVDAFAVNENSKPEIFTLQSGDYAYRLLIEEFGEGAVNLSEDGLIVYTNNYFAELLRSSYEKVIGSTMTDFVAAEHRERFLHLMNEAKSGKSRGEINLITPNGQVPVNMSLTTLQPKLPTIGIIISDLTEKKKYEETLLRYQNELEGKNTELAQSNLELDSFSYIASHDLQEPLRKIQTFCDIILMNGSEKFTSESRDHFDRIIYAAKRMQNLIFSLLNYSRLNSSVYVFEEVNLTEIVDDVLKNLAELIEDNQVTVVTGKLPAVRGIPEQLNQLFTNLLTNSIKYRKSGVPLKISIGSEHSPKNGYWKVFVSDNGIGFDSQYSEKIFELFQRLHSKFEYEGTGIGLSIVKKIVQNHKGFVEAKGTVGVGATFIIHFPE